MNKYILGYPLADPNYPNSIPENLVLYKDKATADFESEEWCEVEAETLDQAKDKYEQAFAEWQRQQGWDFRNEKPIEEQGK